MSKKNSTKRVVLALACTMALAACDESSEQIAQDPGALEGMPPVPGQMPQPDPLAPQAAPGAGSVAAPANGGVVVTQEGVAPGAAQNPNAIPPAPNTTGPSPLNQTGVPGQTNQFSNTPSQVQPNGVAGQTNHFNAPAGSGAAPGAGATQPPGTGAAPGAGSAQ